VGSMKALVISGGGSKGQYAVGVLRHLLEEKGEQYDIIAGVSVGALIGAFLAQYPKGLESAAYSNLEKLFSPIENKDIWKNWFLIRELAGVCCEPSFYNSSPLEKLVREKLDPAAVRQSGKRLRLGAASLNTGEYKVFDETSIPLSEAVLASASFPAFFKPIKFEGGLWADGGIRTVTPIKSAIDAGATSMDIIVLSAKNEVPVFPKDPTAVDVALRAIELQGSEIVSKDLKLFEMHNQLAKYKTSKKRYVPARVFRPDWPLLDNPLNFDPEEGHRLQLIGYRDAVAVTEGD
jgi:NTE family protein